MATGSKESGMDALKRLSRQTASMGQKMQEEQQQKAEYEKNMQGVVAGLRGISFSVALNQLKTVTPPELYEKIEAMQAQPGTKELRKLVSDLSKEVEKKASKASKEHEELSDLANASRTLAILISLLFSL